MSARRLMFRALILTTLIASLAGCGPAEPQPEPDASPEALFAAARAGELSEVRRLVETGVPIDATDDYGATALLMAASAGRADVVQFLLEAGADPDHEEEFYGTTPFAMAMFQDHPETALVLIRAGADDRESALEAAVRRGDLELARAAVEAGPINESTLAALRERTDDLAPEMREMLEKAETRPDPQPPNLSPGELERYIGRFEGHTSDVLVDVTLEGPLLHLSVDGTQPRALAIVGEDRFRSADGTLEASFHGRAGRIEGLALRRGNGPPESLRHSVAEPLGAAAFRGAVVDAADEAESTVHWPAFRGANASGVAHGPDTLTTWDIETGEGILWQAELPGLGNSSPVVWGDRIFVTTAVADGVDQEIRTGLTGAGTSVDEEVEWSAAACR